MIKFINNIDNLIFEILKNQKVMIVFYDNNNENSVELLEKLTIFDIDLCGCIYLVDFHLFLQDNYNKLNSVHIHNLLKYNNYFLLESQITQLSFLNYENIKKIKTPQIYFIKKNNSISEVKYNTEYISRYDNSNTFINLIINFFKKEKEIKKNNYFSEFNKDGEVYLEINIEDIQKNIIYI